MDSTLLLVLVIVGLTFIGLAIRYGLFRIIDKAGNAIDKKIVDHKNANHPAEAIRLADLYPDLAATLQGSNPNMRPLVPNPTSAQNMASANTSSTLRNGISRLISTGSVQSIPSTPAKSSQSVQTSSTSRRRQAFSPDCCCICGGSLSNGHAVLFSNYQGEARVDENCCNGIALLAQGNDKQQVYQAVIYFSALLPNLQPSVADYLKNYLSSAEQFLQS